MREAFEYIENTLYCGDVALADIARRCGTPTYVYSGDAILERYRAYDSAFGDLPHQVCYAVKANSNLSVLRLLAEAGAGFDIVSGGELFRVLKAGGDAGKVVFSGAGKTAEEVEYALESGIHSFNCESEAELTLIDALASRSGVSARVAIRVNPDVDAATHPYISTGLREHKFGIDIEEAESLYARAMGYGNLRMEGVSCHIGSQLLDTGPLMEAFDKMAALVGRLRAASVPIGFLDLGGGLGIGYKPGESTPGVSGFISSVRGKMAGLGLTITVEPGRSIVGEAGVLLTRVLYRKRNGAKEFVIVDAGMNDLIRPTLYQAYHDIVPLRDSHNGTIVADVVGPVCETGDFLARDREIANVMPGDLVAVRNAGAYGFAQASNYNSRPRVAEAMVQDRQWRVIRRRESFEDLVRGE